MLSSSVRVRSAGPVLAVALTLSTGGVALATAAGAATTTFAYQGEAYGSRVSVGRLVRSGPSAPVYLGCTTTSGLHKTNSTAAVNAAPVLTSGTVTSTASTSSSPTKSQTSATVQGANLLSGLVTATAVRSVSATTHTSTGFHTSAAGTTFTNLIIAGVPFSVHVAPNTRVDIARFGHVILNEQTMSSGPSSASLTVNAIHLVVDRTNALGVPVGTNAVVAHASSGLGGPVLGTLDGRAYGSSAKVGNVVRSGPSFLILMPCTGTNGVLRTHTGAGVTVAGVLATGTITNTVRGTANATTAMGETTSTVERANVLAGLVSATVVKADAHARKNADGTFTFSDAGSSFGTLSVNGHPGIGAKVNANTRIQIAGLGTLYLHRVIRHSNSIEVRMIELVVTQTNQQGLPIGSDVKVAVAAASAH